MKLNKEIREEMKKRVFIMGLVGLLCINQLIPATNICVAEAKEKSEMTIGGYSYDEIYPDNSGAGAWNRLSSDEQKYEKAQIKDSIIQKLGTKLLLETIIKNPMISNIRESGNLKEGATQFMEKINAVKKLLQKNDVKNVLINEYLSLEIPAKTINDYSSMHSDDNLYENIMNLLSDEKFVENLDKDIDIYNRVNFLEGLFLSGMVYNILNSDDKIKLYNKSLQLKKQKEKSEVFSYNSDDELIETLLKDDDVIINNIKTMSAKAANPSSVSVFTPNGTQVIAFCYKENTVNSDAYVADFQRRYKLKRKVIGHGYTKNNCHAYTWIGDHRYWLNVVGSFITDGSYRAVAKGKLPQKYQKIRNNAGDHSGIVIGRGSTGNTIIQTKTGGSPIYQSDIEDEFGTTSQYIVYERNSVC